MVREVRVFGLFRKKPSEGGSQPAREAAEAAKAAPGKTAGPAVQPGVHWDPGKRVLTCIDRKGRKTERKDPSHMFSWTHTVSRVEKGNDKVTFTLVPKQRNDKSKQVTYDIRGNLLRCRDI